MRFQVQKKIFVAQVSNINTNMSSLIDFSDENEKIVSFTSESKLTAKEEQDVKSIMLQKKRFQVNNETYSPNSGLSLHIEFVIESNYLNTKHTTTEMFIEPFVTYASIIYAPINSENDDSGGEGVHSCTVNLYCPDFMCIYASPSSLETLKRIKMLFSTDLKNYEKIIRDANILIFKGCWDVALASIGTTKLNSDDVSNVLYQYFESLDTKTIAEIINERVTNVINYVCLKTR